MKYVSNLCLGLLFKLIYTISKISCCSCSRSFMESIFLSLYDLILSQDADTK